MKGFTAGLAKFQKGRIKYKGGGGGSDPSVYHDLFKW